MLQYNKIYQSLKKVSAEWHAGHVEWRYIWTYLKFYADGSVIYCSSPQKPNDLDWFDKNRDDVFLYKGKYEMKDGFKLYATISMSIGELKLDGCITKQGLILRGNNAKLNSFENWDQYTLITDVSV